VVTELMENGDLFNYIALPGAFSDKVTRYFTHQIIEALKYTHAQGICHRDMKLENLMLDSSFDIKVIDFGFAAQINQNGNNLLTTYLGTKGYLAPEIIYNMSYSGPQADLFATGVIIFSMISQVPPFTEAKNSDDFYKCLVNKRQDLFW